MKVQQPLTKDMRQKTIAQLIQELQSFEDQSLIVMVTSDYSQFIVKPPQIQRR